MMKHSCRFCSGAYAVAYTASMGYLCGNCRRRYIKFKGNAQTRAELSRFLNTNSKTDKTQ